MAEEPPLDMLTTIKIDSRTRDQLADLGKKNESYDTIIRRLIAAYQQVGPEHYIKIRPNKD